MAGVKRVNTGKKEREAGATGGGRAELSSLPQEVIVTGLLPWLDEFRQPQITCMPLLVIVQLACLTFKQNKEDENNELNLSIRIGYISITRRFSNYVIARL